MKTSCWITLVVILEYRATSGGKSQLCEIDSGRTNIIVDIHESRGNSTDQVTNPLELPIIGDVTTEIILQLLRNNSVFALDGKKLVNIEPVDRDETKLNHIVLQISCTVRSSNKRRILPVIVRVSDINDNAPIFVNTPYEITIPEATPVGTTVFRDIRAEDKDAGVNGLVEYFIIKGENYSSRRNAFFGDGYKTFDIPYPHQGQVTVVKTLDFEKIQRYYVTVVASDRARNSSERLSSTTTLTINIADSDDLDPSFIYRGCTVHQGACVNPRYTANIFPGELPRLLTVFPERIQAIDLDTLNARIKYSLLTGKPDDYNNFIEIDEESGQLKQIRAVDESTAKEYEIIVKAEENSESKRFTTAKLRVVVKLLDANPPVLSASDIVGFVQENSPVGTAVIAVDGEPIRFRITDADLHDEHSKPNYTYELTTSYFSVSLENILIVNVNNLDRDPPKQDKYRFQVVARETFRNAASSPLSLTVNLVDVNDNPPKFVKAYPLVVVTGENKQVVTKVEARDNDAGKNGIVKYSIYHVSNDGRSIFSINENTGQIETLSRIPPGGKYSLTIRATDRGGLYSQVVVEVIVRHEKNTKPPNFLNSVYEVEVSEDVGINTTVIVVHAVDPENESVSYLITSGNDLRQFAIDRENGEISVIRKLDRESLTRYQLVVRAQNQGGLSSSCIVNIRVVDVNDENPQFDKSTYCFFAEEDRKSAVVGSVHATDADEGINAQIKYLLPPDIPFKINSDTGEISTNVKLDYETQNKYKFIVTAKDMSTLSRSGSSLVIVTVTDIQDERPRFEEPQILVRVPENLSNYHLLFVKAVDMDVVKQVTYVLRKEQTNFKIDAKSGEIKTTQGLDYEKKRSHELHIGVFENSEYDAEEFVKVIVHVVDKNDNTPIFQTTLAPIVINNGIEVGEVLGKVSAIDGDGTSPANEVRYELIGVGKALKYFTVNQSFGTIQVLNKLNDETDTEYQIVLRAYDLGQPMLSSVMTVPVLLRRLPLTNITNFQHDVERSTFPQETHLLLGFKDRFFELNVPENTKLNTTLKFLEVRIQKGIAEQVANDFECIIEAGDELNVFQLLPNNGGCNLTLAKQLDLKVKRQFTLKINLLSHTLCITPEKSSVAVNIFVLNETGSSSGFVFKEFLNRKSKTGFYGVVVLDAEIGSTILQVNAIHDDAGKLSSLIYSIYDDIDSVASQENAPSTYFSIGELSGVLTTRKKIQKVERFPLQFLVAVRDSGSGTSSTLAHAKIVINLITNENRMSLGFSSVLLSEVENHWREFENMLNKYAEKLIVIIEHVSNKTFLNSNSSITGKDHSIDLIFCAIDIKADKILPSNSSLMVTYFHDLKSQSDIKLEAAKIMKGKGEVIGIFSYFEPKFYNKTVWINDENNIDVFKYIAIIISMIILALGTSGIVYVWISGSRLEFLFKERRSLPPSQNMPLYYPVENGFQQDRQPRNSNEFETHITTFNVPVHSMESTSSLRSLKKSGKSNTMPNNVKESVFENSPVHERHVRANVKNVVRQRTLRKVYSTGVKNMHNEAQLCNKKAHPNSLTLGRLKHSSNDYANIARRSENYNNQKLQQLQDKTFSYTLDSRSFFKRNYLVSGAKNNSLAESGSDNTNVYTVDETYTTGTSDGKIVLARHGLPPLGYSNIGSFDRSDAETTTEL